MNKAPSDRAAVPERSEGFPLSEILFLSLFVILAMAWIPTVDAVASAYRAHTEEMIKQRRCEDTTKPVTGRAVR